MRKIYALIIATLGLVLLLVPALPVAGNTFNDPSTPCPTTTPVPGPTEERPPISPPTPRPPVDPPDRPPYERPSNCAGSVISGTVTDVCLNKPGAGVQVWIAKTTLPEGAVLQVQVNSPDGGVLHVRSGSGTGYESLATVANGTILTVLDSLADLARKVEQQDQWIKVRTAEGVEGYAAAWYLLPYNLEALITHVVITDAQGNYSQGGLWEGEYAVWVNPPAGAMATQPPVVVNLNGCNGAEVNLEYCGQLLMLPVSGFALSTGARLMLAIAGFALVVGGLVFYGSKLRSRA